ncbi:hypothetical protein JCM16303_005580 [Sporobolomyces ruberrimus]
MTSTLTASPVASPLKRLNTAGAPRPKSKLASHWESWSTDPDHATTLDPVKYYREFFCLTPNRTVEQEAIAKLTRDELLGTYKNNVSILLVTAVEILKETQKDTLVQANIVQTLIVLFKDVLDRDYEHPSEDIVSILVGEPEKADQTFTDLVASIDSILQDSTLSPALRHSTLQLATLLVTSLGTSPLATYFLRRDLFSSLINFVVNEQTKRFAFDATLLIGLLTGYKQEVEEGGDPVEAKNPYAVRIQDFVEEATMTRIINLVTAVMIRSRDAYVAIQNDSPPSVVSSLTSIVLNLNKLFYIGNPFAWSLPSLPSSIDLTSSAPPPQTIDSKGKGKAIEPDHETTKEERVWTANPTPDVSTPGSIAPGARGGGDTCGTSIKSFRTETSIQSPPLSSSSDCRSPSHRPLLRKTFSSSSSLVSTDPFYEMPLDRLAILVTLYEFWKVNKTFASLVFANLPGLEDQPPTLPPTLISISSYIFSHASTNRRSQVYSRLCLNLLMMLVEDGDGKLTYEVEPDSVRLCRQRRPILSNQNVTDKRPLVACLIDSVVLFLRFNLKKRLDVDSYAIALRLLQRTMQQLKSEQIKLEYDWVVVWRSILTLSSFVVTHVRDLRTMSDQVDNLISQIFITISYAVYWGEQLLPSPFAQAQLYYKLLHSDQVLSSLSDVLGISSLASPKSTFDASTSPPRLRGVDPLSPLPKFYFTSSNDQNGGATSPTHSVRSLSATAPRSGGGGGTGAGFVATECISNIRTTLSFFQNLIKRGSLSLLDSDQGEGQEQDPLEPHEILAIIEKNLGGVELIESAAMGDLGRYAGSKEGRRAAETFEADLMTVVREDARRLFEKKEDLGLNEASQ